MKSKFAPAYLLMFILFTAYISIGRFNNPPDGRTGAPGDGLCTDCHNPPSSGQNGTISITGLPATIMPNTTYNITVTTDNPNGMGVHGGFQLVVLNSGNSNSGTLSNPSTSSTLTPSGGRTYWEHNPAKNLDGNNQAAWTVDWTSPTGPDMDQITMYAAGNITNGNSSTSGDLIVTSTSSGMLMGQPDPLSVNITNSTDITCNGDMDGTATAEAAGGTPPYTYAWSSGDAGEMATNLGPGMVTVTVTDNDLNTATDQVLISEPDPISISITNQMNVTCNGESDGSITVSASGGTGVFTYDWSNGGSGPTINNLSADSYTVTATDDNLCTSMLTIEITQPDAIIVQLISSTNETCNGAEDGTAEVSASGGTGNFTYIWSTGETGPMAFMLPGGFNEVSVTDDNACTTIFEVEITSPDALILSTINTPIQCHGDSNGVAEAIANGGIPPYTYMWSNGESGEIITDLPPGTYTVTVTDDNNCMATEQVVFAEPELLEANAEVLNNVLCNGENNGLARALPQGGTPGYEYNWSNGATTNVIQNLGPGLYIVTVTDMNDCETIDSITISAPDALVASASGVMDVSCPNTADGMANIDIAGGTMPYTISWPDGSSAEMRNDLASGLYTVTVTDVNNCLDTANVQIGAPDPLTASFTSNQPSCFGDSDGSITANAAGGTGPYNYAWNTGSTDATLSGIGAGTYMVTITDMNNCIDSFTVVLGQPAELIVILSGTDESSAGASDGTISSTVSGGTTPYNYAWSNGDTTASVDSLAPGLYTLIVTDDNGCADTSSYTVNAFGCALVVNGTVTDLSCFEDNSGAITISIEGAEGMPTITWSNGSDSTTINGLSAGLYSVTVTDTANCTMGQTYLVSQPDDITLDGSSNNESAAGANDGSAVVTPSGGTAPYVYNWSNGSADSLVSGLMPGAYTVTVTDDNGCIDSMSFVISEFGCDLTVSITADACPNDPNFTYCAVVTGGTQPYTYMWHNGSTDSCITTNDFTTTLTVTDANNCQVMSTSTITPPEMVSLVIDSAISSTGVQDGGLLVTVLGTDGWTVSFEWTTTGNQDVVGQNEDLLGVAAGFYDLHVMLDDCIVVFDSLEVPIQVGVADRPIDFGIAVYPNPADNQIMVEIGADASAVVNRIELLDMHGKVIRTESNAADLKGGIILQTQNYPGGIYLLKLTTDKGVLVEQMVILHE